MVALRRKKQKDVFMYIFFFILFFFVFFFVIYFNLIRSALQTDETSNEECDLIGNCFQCVGKLSLLHST